MKDRIIQFLSENNLTSTKFADSIGVQRSSISHILSGRNKPSYDFIEKMLNAYPDLNAQWLITGKGNMFLNQPDLFSQDSSNETSILTQQESDIQTISNQPSEKTVSDPVMESNIPTGNDNPVERIVFFHKDGSFKEYKPG